MEKISYCKFKKYSLLPGFKLTLGFTIFYLFLIVLIPLTQLFFNVATLSLHQFWLIVTSPRVIHSFQLSFGLACLAAIINAFFGLIIAWVLVRYHFPGRKLIDALIDLPFALPTSIAGIALTILYAPQGWIGSYFTLLGLKIAFTPLGILIALIFVGLPFIVRTVQPALEDMDAEWEEAAVCLGASRWQTFTQVIFPMLAPALLTGFAMAFARALGEYGAVIFIAGNIPNVSEIVPLLIISKLEQFDYAGASAIAVAMLLASFLILLMINILQKWNYNKMEK